MSKKWDLSISGGGDTVGGWWPVRNLAQGYHGIEKQWWEWYTRGKVWPNVLLISEGEETKEDFKKVYPEWNIDVTDLPHDICRDSLGIGKYDLIICQATLEHLYDPFSALYNMARSLKDDGIIVIHTQAQKFPYHAWPTDCFRFMDDWWTEVEKHLPLELVEFHNHNNYHVFACYRRVK